MVLGANVFNAERVDHCSGWLYFLGERLKM